ncbi:MAG: inorganic diphosphatase, partial [Actinomycetota bacterium]|nr:inorganic diphosphatase [Actinomycetota bacterium]
VVGVMNMVDEKGPDAKIVAVPQSDPRWRHINTLDDVPDHLLAEIEHFFSIYKDLEQKLVDVQGWGTQEEALREVAASRRRHQGA